MQTGLMTSARVSHQQGCGQCIDEQDGWCISCVAEMSVHGRSQVQSPAKAASHPEFAAGMEIDGLAACMSSNRTAACYSAL